MSVNSGLVADIQRYCLHDGPGIRTSVFLKGCNMNCLWCHNPETIAIEPQYIIDESKCIQCGQCEDGCFAGARILCGVEKTVDEIVDVVVLDAPYYGDDGGVTVTGGEPTMQAKFSAGILEACKAKKIHTAIETNMFSSWGNIEKVLKHTDLVMADLKFFDNTLHREWTGVDNNIIKENLIKTSMTGVPIILRTPVIAGLNGTAEEIGLIADFASKLPTLVYYEILPYHKLGLSKGKLNGITRKSFEKPSQEIMNQLCMSAKSKCSNVMLANKKVQ